MAGFTINMVCVSGNLTRDPELRQTQSGMDVCNLGIAVNERVKNKATDEWEDRPNYFDVTVWGGMGKWLGDNLRKGQAVVVSGRLNWRSWEKDGQKRSAVSIVADSVVPERDRDGGGGFGGRSGGGSQSSSSSGQGDFGDFAPASSSKPSSTYDDDIPF